MQSALEIGSCHCAAAKHDAFIAASSFDVNFYTWTRLSSYRGMLTVFYQTFSQNTDVQNALSYFICTFCLLHGTHMFITQY